MPFGIVGPHACTFVTILISFFILAQSELNQSGLALRREGFDTAMTAAPIFARRENTQEKLRLVTLDW
jgi:hypothetical protein